MCALVGSMVLLLVAPKERSGYYSAGWKAAQRVDQWAALMVDPKAEQWEK